MGADRLSSILVRLAAGPASLGDIPVAAGDPAVSRLRSTGSVVPFVRLLLPFVVAVVVAVVAGGVSAIEGVVTAGGATEGGG